MFFNRLIALFLLGGIGIELGNKRGNALDIGVFIGNYHRSANDSLGRGMPPLVKPGGDWLIFFA